MLVYLGVYYSRTHQEGFGTAVLLPQWRLRWGTIPQPRDRQSRALPIVLRSHIGLIDFSLNLYVYIISEISIKIKLFLSKFSFGFAFYALEKAAVSRVSLLSHITAKRTSTFLVPNYFDGTKPSYSFVKGDMAEMVGFEPTKLITVCSLSRGVDSARLSHISIWRQW